MSDRVARLDAANELIAAIACCGHRFFRNSDDNFVSRLELDDRGRVWFIDYYSKRRIYTHYPWGWSGFTSGGTLRGVIEHLRDFVVRGETVHPGVFGLGRPSHWGYGPDMQIVSDAAVRLGIVDMQKQEAPHA